MLVKIGPYSRRWYSHIHFDYMNRKYKNEWIDSTNTFERLLEKYENFLEWVYNKTINKIIGQGAEQRVKVRIDDYDVWSMDDTLALIIAPMLKLLKEKKHGSAYVDDADVPEELRLKPDVKTPDHDNLVEKRWDYVLGEMTWAFERKARCGIGIDYDSPTYKEDEKRMRNGFCLFGKYYEALWD